MKKLRFEENTIKCKYSVFGGQILYMTPIEGEVWDFSDNEYVLAFDILNPSDMNQGLFVKMETANYEIRNGRTFRAYIPAATTSTVYVLASDDAPYLNMHTLPPTSNGEIIASRAWDNDESIMDVKRINHIQIWNMSDQIHCEFEISNMRIEKNPMLEPSKCFKGIVDKFGQNALRDWDGKVKEEKELFEIDAEEDVFLDQWLDDIEISGERTIYGGYKCEKLKQKATGRFYVTKIGRQWTYIDPLGYPYFSIGLDVVRILNTRTTISGREYMFQEIPERYGEYEEHFTDHEIIVKKEVKKTGVVAYNYYTANIQKKFGKDWYQKWYQKTVKRFKAWGLTSLGCWAEPDLFEGRGSDHKTPYEAFVATTTGDHSYIFSSIPDMYDPKYLEAVHELIDEVVARGVNDDPYCIGIFVDNEIQWGRAMESESEHYKGVEFAFKKDSAECFTKLHFIEILKEKYVTIDKLNVAWDSQFEDFEALKKPYFGNISIEDKSMMLSDMAHKYYSMIREVLNEKLPDILYLGSRLANWGTSAEIIDACSQYVDVISFNCYKEHVNQIFMDFDRYDKPLLIGEFHMCGCDKGHYAPGLVPAGNCENRGKMYKDFVESALYNGRFVGVHWFQYCDQPMEAILGKIIDGENCNIGFVDVVDRPYYDLLDYARPLHKEMYDKKFKIELQK